MLASGFPNLLLISLVQGGFGTNFSHLLSESAKHVAHIVEACVEQGIVAIEPEEAAEEEWLSVLHGVGVGGARYFLSCTPSFYNSEQQAIDARAARNLTYSGSLLDYVGYLERWREDPDFAGRQGAAGGARRRTVGLRGRYPVPAVPSPGGGGSASGLASMALASITGASVAVVSINGPGDIRPNCQLNAAPCSARR